MQNRQPLINPLAERSTIILVLSRIGYCKTCKGKRRASCSP